MKRPLLSIVLVLLALSLSAQKLSNYEKYWQAREDSIAKSQTTLNTDTLIQKESPDTVIVNNYYYDEDPFFYSNNIGRFYHDGFNCWMYGDPWFYDYSWYDYNWYWGFGFMGDLFWNPWYYGGWYPWHTYRWHNHEWHNHGYPPFHRPVLANNYLANRRTATIQQPQSKALYQTSRRTYTPSYINPRLSIRPQYNNSRVNNISNRRTQISTQARTYRSQNYSQSTTGRSSQPQGFGRAFNFSSGGNRSSGGSGSRRR